ncbi:MAG: SAF domain-containing protein [Ilumatobacteraceae bacterium]
MIQRIRNSATVAQFSNYITPVVARANSVVRAGYSRLCRDHRLRHRAIALGAGIAAGVFFVNVIQLQSQKSQLAANFTVLVATANIAIGDTVTAAEVRPLRVPASLVATTVLIHLPTTAFAQQSIGVGEVITSINVGEKSSNTSAVPAGWRTVAITAPTALPPMSAGDRVDVIANGVVLVANAVVVSTRGEESTKGSMELITQVVIGVPAISAPSVATAAALGDATLVVAL